MNPALLWQRDVLGGPWSRRISHSRRSLVFYPSLTRRGRMVYNQGNSQGQVTQCSMPGDTIHLGPFSPSCAG